MYLSDKQRDCLLHRIDTLDFIGSTRLEEMFGEFVPHESAVVVDITRALMTMRARITDGHFLGVSEVEREILANCLEASEWGLRDNIDMSHDVRDITLKTLALRLSATVGRPIKLP